jgi:serine/threonine protein kinase
VSERDESPIEKLLRDVASAPDRNPAALSGERLGRFRVTRLIARGGMGIVYEALDEQLNRPVALKVMASSYAADADHRRGFLREARSAAQATPHPNIATVYEVGDAEGQIYIAMELVAGETLGAVLDARRLTTSEALGIAEQIGRGLSCAHERGVVHRDLKPDNVMLTREGVVKLLDFGIAKVRDDAAGFALETGPETQNGVIRGTPAYMSPEQATGKPVDARTDVFSFGVVLYEMLAGVRPFEGASKMDLLVAIVRDPPNALSTADARVTRELEAVVLRCLDKDPARRFQTIAETLDAISRAKGAALAEAMRAAPAAPSFAATGVEPRDRARPPVTGTSSLGASIGTARSGRPRSRSVVALFACFVGVGAVLGIRSRVSIAITSPPAVHAITALHPLRRRAPRRLRPTCEACSSCATRPDATRSMNSKQR